MDKKKLGVLLSTPPENKNLETVISLASQAVGAGITVYLYFIDDGVLNIGQPAIDALADSGVHLFACAYGAGRRGVPQNNKVVFAGLVVLANIIKGCDRFLAF
ncbi:MAG: DsrE family protein [Nitrospirae bacterium]|nr:DsrE family protein [Candidatus Troglogloeales bacterium]MBI3598067.1 DsrE family protein [Candidatus Troglogloeales bacterium]